jgi:hypothetical protein
LCAEWTASVGTETTVMVLALLPTTIHSLLGLQEMLRGPSGMAMLETALPSAVELCHHLCAVKREHTPDIPDLEGLVVRDGRQLHSSHEIKGR